MRKIWMTAMLLLMIVCILCGCSGTDYKEAGKLLEQGNYEEARVLYQQLEEEGGYKDSGEKIRECDYLEAEAACQVQNYALAYDLFTGLEDYKDASDRAVETGYALANQFAANENYSEAVRLFLALRDYKNSIELAEACAERMMANPVVGATVFYGSYEQDGNEENGAEPIEWIVLGKNENHLLLISEYILEKERFGTSCFWEESQIRQWLNGTFYDTAFSADEQGMIQKMITSDKTEDHVFLLNAEEARGFFASDEDRVAYITAYMEAEAFRGYEGKGEWWTRSISTAANGKGVVEVECDGNVRSAGCAPDVPNAYSSSDIGVRPVVCIHTDGGVVEEAQNMSLFGFDSNTHLDNEPDIWDRNRYSGSSGGKCIVCNGTGYVRYYYGSSDLEAWLSGHDSFTVGSCTSCDGTGKD